MLTGTRSVCPERTALDQRELMPVWGVSRRLLDLDRVYGVGRSSLGCSFATLSAAHREMHSRPQPQEQMTSQCVFVIRSTATGESSTRGLPWPISEDETTGPTFPHLQRTVPMFHAGASLNGHVVARTIRTTRAVVTHSIT